MSLFPEGSYRLEAHLAAIAKLKLIERPRGVPDIQEADLESLSEVTESQEALG